MEQTNPQSHIGNEGGRALAIIKAALALPGTKVDRSAFLRDQLRAHCSERQVGLAIDFNPAHAKIPIVTIDKIADSVIRSQNLKAAAGSFVAGIPGGIAMTVTIPLDLAQNTGHAIVLAQKLAYLYGWPDLFLEDAPDEETQLRMALLLGSMLGLRKANILLRELSSRFASQVATRLPKYALTKTVYYPVIKQICKWLGIKLTKATFAQGVAKIIPLVGGGISGTATGLVQRNMARRLKNHLRELEFAKPSQDKPTTIVIDS